MTADVKKMAQRFLNDIEQFAKAGQGKKGRKIRIMEVCGTHTMSIFRSGIRDLLPADLELVSGPGCPVCVTPASYLEQAMDWGRQPSRIITSFGDMLRVPGKNATLAEMRSEGMQVEAVYSPLDALEIARKHKGREVLFLAVGFETTVPTIGATIVQAEREGIENFSVFTAHKRVPPVLQHLLQDVQFPVDGFLLPGHVLAVSGLVEYGFLADVYKIPSVVAGFEALDILQSLAMLLRQVTEGQACLENQYSRVVTKEGNPVARKIMEQVFYTGEGVWRGLGRIPGSALRVVPEYRQWDGEYRWDLAGENDWDDEGCRCGMILQGRMTPEECPLFATSCRPENPVGACMVSGEGTCAAWYKYGSKRRGTK